MTAKRQELVICHDLNHLGQGVARLPDGLTAFVDNLLPGEQALVEITEEKPSYAKARIVKCLQTSVERVSPPCPLAGRCGGCSLQHVDYQAQLFYKTKSVRDAFIRIGGFSKEQIDAILPAERPTAASDPPWHYRCKAQLPIQGDSVRPSIGFYALGSHRVVDGQSCLIQHPAVDLIRAALRSSMRRHKVQSYDEKTRRGLLRHLVVRCGESSRDVSVTLVVYMTARELKFLSPRSETAAFFADFFQSCQNILSSSPYDLCAFYINHNTKTTNVITGSVYSTYYRDHDVNENINGIDYRISPASFFQVNPKQSARLFQAIVRLSQLSAKDLVFELYCGTAGISLQLARLSQKLIGCEIVTEAIEDARKNALANGIKNVEFYVGAAEKILPDLLPLHGRPDLIVVDPPRKGLAPSLISCIREAAPSRIVYVSCDPATLARDCALFCLDGLYSLNQAETFDMFPHSMHVETVVLMSRIED